MQVRGAHTDGVYQHFLQEANDRSVFAVILFSIFFGFIGAGGIFAKFEVVGADAVHSIACAARSCLDQMGKLVIFGNDPFHTHLGGELDFFSGFVICGIGCCDDEPVASLAQRQDAVFDDQLAVDQILREAVGVNGRGINERRRECSGNGVRQVEGGNSAGAS